MEFGDDDASDTASVRSGTSSRISRTKKDTNVSGQVRLKVPSAIPRLRLQVMDEQGSEAGSQDLNGMDNETLSVLSGGSPRRTGFDTPFTFKVLDPNGSLHKINASAERCAPLFKILCERLKCSAENLRLTYKDQDGDDIAVTDDASLSEAVDTARSNGDDFARLKAEIDESGLLKNQTAPVASSLVVFSASDPTPLTEKDSPPEVPGTPGAGAVSNGSGHTPPAKATQNNPVVLAGGLALLAGAVIAGIIFLKKQNNY